MYLQTKRILCVDDDEATREMLTTMLGLSGLEAVCVGDVVSAKSLMGSEQFCLYIIDSQLPGVSGMTMCEEIRRRDKETPIIIFSGKVFPGDRDAGLRAGADAYLFKPETDQIVPTVRRLLETAGQRVTGANT
jgi:DNA-binding response OmpR family regulator